MRFVIIGSPRTGSSYLTQRLRRQTDILCHGEVFHQRHVWVYWPKRDLTDAVRAELDELRRTNPEALLARVFATDYGRACVGFKIFGGQCDDVLSSIIADPSIRKVVLFRRNVLANYSSALAAGRSGSWSTTEMPSDGSRPKVQFRAGRFIRFHNEYIAFYRRVIAELNEKREPFQLINYEDIGDPFMFECLINFIGGDPALGQKTLKNQLKKQNTTDIMSRFSNPDEVAAFLTVRRLLHWAHEADTDFGPLGLLEEEPRTDDETNV